MMMHRHHPRQRGLHDQSLLLVVCAVTTAIVTIITSIPFVQAQQAAAINVVVDCSTNQIIVAFDGIMNGNDDWIGLYRESALAGTFPNLPDHALELYEDWFTTCQTKDVCPFWHRSGQVVFDLQADLERSAELRVVLGQGESTETVAVSNVFRVDEVCAVGGGVADDTAGADTAGADDTNTDNIDDILLAVQECHDDLQDLIENDLPLIGMLLRLVFHDCVGGCDGCVDMSNPDNGGLDGPISALQPIVDLYGPRGLSRTDVWMLSGLVASEVALPPSQRDDIGDFPLHWFGRKTCFNDDILGGPHRDLCHGTAGTQTIQTFFQNEFGFTDHQIVAIMGAHSVGRMRRQNTGNTGTWDLTPTRLDSGYFLEVTFMAPDYRLVEIDNSDIVGMPNTFQWEGIANEGEDDEARITMMNSDLALVMNVNDVGEVDCEFLDDNGIACSRDTPFAPFMREFADDTELFLNDFRDVLNLLIDHGHSKANGCDPATSGICRFD